jgi:hypothetical protein
LLEEGITVIVLLLKVVVKGTGVPVAFPRRNSIRFCALESLIAELSVSLTFSLKAMVGFTAVEVLLVLLTGW